MIRFVCLQMVWLMLWIAAATGQTRWSSIRPGLEVLDGSFLDQGHSVTFIMIRCDPKKHRVRVIDTFLELRKTNSFAAFSVMEVKNKTGALVVVNAGSTASYSIPAPVGLLQIRGKILNKPNFQAQHAGVLCIADDHAFIFPLSSNTQPRCVDAVQRGPFLSRESLTVPDPSPNRYRRTVAAVDAEGRLVILVTRESTKLSSIVSYLFDSHSDLNLQSAVNLDGDASSGLVFALENKLQTVGSVDGLVASAIAIYE